MATNQPGSSGNIGVRLMPELYEHLNPMPFEAAVQMETELAEATRFRIYSYGRTLIFARAQKFPRARDDTDYANRPLQRCNQRRRIRPKTKPMAAQSTQPWRDSFARTRQYFVLMSGRSRWPRPRLTARTGSPCQTFRLFRFRCFLGSLLSRRTGSGSLPFVLFPFHFFLRGDRRSLIHVIFFSHVFRFPNFYLFGADASRTVLISSAPAFLKISFARSTSSLSSAWTATK